MALETQCFSVKAELATRNVENHIEKVFQRLDSKKKGYLTLDDLRHINQTLDLRISPADLHSMIQECGSK